MAAMERACRRGRIPVAMTEGFNPRPRIGFPLALGVGIAGLNEVMDMQLAEWTNPVRLAERLDRGLPEGLSIQGWEHGYGPSFRARFAGYRIDLPSPPSPELRQRIESLNLQDAIPVTRRMEGKPDRRVDLRPFVERIAVDGSAVTVDALVTDRGTLRPDEVFEALGEPLPPETAITRTDVRAA